MNYASFHSICRLASRISRGRAWLVSVLLIAGCGATQHRTAGSVETGGDPLHDISAAKLFGAGELLAARGEHVRAEQYLKAALDRGYPAEEALPVLLQVCVSASRLGAALRYADAYLYQHPDDRRMRYLVASLLVGLHRMEDAHRELMRVIRAPPTGANAESAGWDDAAPHYLLGMIAAEDPERRAQARHHFSAYLARAPRGRYASDARSRLLEPDSDDWPHAAKERRDEHDDNDDEAHEDAP